MQFLKPEIRDRILSRAERLFFEKGYEGATLREIADAVGVSVSNLYKYFANKDSLYRAVVEDYANQFLRGMKGMLAHSNKEEFARDRTTGMVRGLSRAINEKPMSFVVLMKRSKGSPLEGFRATCAGLLVSHVLREDLLDPSEKFLANMLIGNLLEAIADIAADHRNAAWVERELGLLFKYHMGGMKALKR